MKSLCVFCGSNPGVRPEYLAVAKELGLLLAQHRVTLVYGGGNLGLMGVTADACMAGGGEVIGVIPKSLMDKEHGHMGITRLEVVGSMHQRKARMAELSGGFLALPGGFGTLEELLEMLTWVQLGIQSKPVGIINTAGFFEPLLKMLDHAMDQGFLRPANRALLLTAENPSSALERLSAWRPIEMNVGSNLEG